MFYRHHRQPLRRVADGAEHARKAEQRFYEEHGGRVATALERIARRLQGN